MGTKWPREVKARAIAICGERGAKAASEETGVPPNTLRSWIRRESIAFPLAPRVETVIAEIDGHRPWPLRRDAVVAELAKLCEETVQATFAAVRAGNLREAQAGWVSIGIAIDKLQLLSGEATSRSQSQSLVLTANTAREIAELEAELGMPALNPGGGDESARPR